MRSHENCRGLLTVLVSVIWRPVLRLRGPKNRSERRWKRENFPTYNCQGAKPYDRDAAAMDLSVLCIFSPPAVYCKETSAIQLFRAYCPYWGWSIGYILRRTDCRRLHLLPTKSYSERISCASNMSWRSELFNSCTGWMKMLSFGLIYPVLSMEKTAGTHLKDDCMYFAVVRN